MHYRKPFDELTDQQIIDYAYVLRERNVSESTLKFLIFAFCFYFKVNKLKERKLPFIGSKKKTKTPQILSQQEIKQILVPKNCPNLKHRVILCLLYSAGLRVGELLALKMSDIDYDRKTICIQNGKGNIRRYVVLSKIVAKGLKLYLEAYKPKTYVFESYQKGHQYSSTSVGSILRKTLHQAKISKKISVHELRHCFAVHFLEQGGNIIQLKDQLGHSSIKTTLIYLKVAHASYQEIKSPLDVLFNL